MKGRIVYIAGQITGRPKGEYMAEFDRWQSVLENDCGMLAINPARILDPLVGLTHSEYIVICKAMIDIADVVVLIPGWEYSKGAKIERSYALRKGKMVIEDIQQILKTMKEFIEKGETDEQCIKA